MINPSQSLSRFATSSSFQADASNTEHAEKTAPKHPLRNVILATLCISLTAYAGMASGQEAYFGGKARVNKSAALRAETEFLASATCRLDAGIDAQTALSDLQGARGTFEKVLAGLEHGDPALGIPTAESRRKSLNALNEVSSVLGSMGSALDLSLIHI